MTSNLEGQVFGGGRTEDKNNKSITRVIIEDGDDVTKTLVLTDERLYMEEAKHRKDGEAITTKEILSRAPILEKIIQVEGRELLVVSYGKIKAIGNIEEIIKIINRTGGVMHRDFKIAISAMLEAQRVKVKVETAFACTGVFVNPDGEALAIAIPQYNNVYHTDLKENGEANIITSQIEKRAILPKSDKRFKTALTGYINLSQYVKPLDMVPIMYSAATPFIFELKAIEKQDYFCQILLHGPKGTGKSTTANIATDDLFGISPKGIDYIDSPFRILQILNGTGLAQHIAEMETFDFDEFADTIKNGTDIRNVGSRGNADQTQNHYYGKSTLYYSANAYKASKPALLSRILMIPAQCTREEIAPRHHLFNAHVRMRTKTYAIGYTLLQAIIDEYRGIKAIAQEVNNIRNQVTYHILNPALEIELTDNRRTLTYALILFGIRQWQKFIHSVYPKLAEKQYSELWFNKYANIELFVEDIIRPLENISLETMQQVPAAAFIAWLESFISNLGEKEEGYTWMHAKKGDYIYITAGVLQQHKKHAKQTGGAVFESLDALATELKAHTGEDCKPYSMDIGRDEERDPDTGRITKTVVPYKSRKAVRVPMHPQGKLTVAVQQSA